MTEQYRRFIISWQEPPLTGARWTANVVTDDRQLFQLIGANKIIDGTSKEDMLLRSRRYVDSVLDRKE